MTTRDPYLHSLRSQAQARIADNAVALGMEPTSGSPPQRGEPDGSYQLALNRFDKAVVKGVMHASGADAGFDRTVGRMTGGQFSTPEIQSLEDHALDAATRADIPVLKGIGEGPPVILNPTQKAVIDRLMGQLGSDDLANRARGAYQGAIRAGQVRTR